MVCGKSRNGFTHTILIFIDIMDRRITIIGAGNVGATVAHEIARQDLAKEVVLVDVKDGIAEGKALDQWQTSSI
jgi:2-polyprenyl-6-methoxyphenol hydroxylase-like FAD-dependent oxidoreductase